MASYWLLGTLWICNGETTATCRCHKGRMIHGLFAVIVIVHDAVDRILACATYYHLCLWKVGALRDGPVGLDAYQVTPGGDTYWVQWHCQSLLER